MNIEDDVHRVLSQIQPAGCLQEQLGGFANQLISNDYTVLSARDYMRSAAHLGRWMEVSGVELDEFSEETIAKFDRHRCECPGVWRHGHAPSQRCIARVRRFVAYLRDRGVVVAEPAAAPQEIRAPLVGFREWLDSHRGLAERTIGQYEDRIASMLPALGSDPSRYNARLVRRVILTESRNRHLTYTKTFVTALRAFLRFLAAQGKCAPHLDRAVPAIREWKLSALPRYLEAHDVERVIASCDQTRPQGIRDRAVLLLLARLGLRAGDIVALRLDDLDWSHGRVRVRGKGKKEVRLPLPQDVGDAVLDYLRSARPSSNHERLFLCTNAPVRPFGNSSVVSSIVRGAIERAGLPDPPSKGAHLLRHSAATIMLRSGASLDTVATVLRHESSDMTAHYAKVDLVLLESVVQPWPEVSSC